jgi:NAD(P)-dependent dehydrogenase (short-subunit alcohol dehydrogenase family)
MGFAGAVLRFFIIFNSNSGKDEPQTLHYAITQNCSMGADVRQARKAWSDPAKAGPMLARMPLGRFIEADEVAEAVLFLLSDRASAVNGISMPVDTGFAIS